MAPLGKYNCLLWQRGFLLVLHFLSSVILDLSNSDLSLSHDNLIVNQREVLERLAVLEWIGRSYLDWGKSWWKRMEKARIKIFVFVEHPCLMVETDNSEFEYFLSFRLALGGVQSHNLNLESRNFTTRPQCYNMNKDWFFNGEPRLLIHIVYIRCHHLITKGPQAL